MNNVKRLEQKLDNEKLIYSLDQYADYGLLSIYADTDFKALRLELLEKYKLKDIAIINHFINQSNFHDLPDEIEIVENDFKFIVKLRENPNSFPIDKKLARELIRDHTNKKDVLDLFGNTGTFSIYAAANAASVTYVESNESNVQIFEKNIQLNYESKVDQPRHQVKPQIWTQNYEEFIQIARETRTKFDVIILDLSKYTLKNITSDEVEGFDLQKDHLELIKLLQDKLLNPAGFIFLITDVEDFVLDRYIRPGADKLSKQTIAQEFLPLKVHQSYAFYN